MPNQWPDLNIQSPTTVVSNFPPTCSLLLDGGDGERGRSRCLLDGDGEGMVAMGLEAL